MFTDSLGKSSPPHRLCDFLCQILSSLTQNIQRIYVTQERQQTFRTVVSERPAAPKSVRASARPDSLQKNRSSRELIQNHRMPSCARRACAAGRSGLPTFLLSGILQKFPSLFSGRENYPNAAGEILDRNLRLWYSYDIRKLSRRCSHDTSHTVCRHAVFIRSPRRVFGVGAGV